MTPLNSDKSTERWLRAAGIIDLQQGQATLHALKQLPLPFPFDGLESQLPELLSSLSDSLGSFRAFHLYCAKKIEDQDELAEIQQNSDRLKKLLRSLDLGSQVQDWLIQHDVQLSKLDQLPGMSEFHAQTQKLLLQSIAHDAGRNTASRKAIAVQRSIMIDIALQHFYQQESIDVTLQRNSILADTIIGWCYERCFQLLVNKFGTPCRDDRTTARCSMLASSELGGQELNLDSPLTLMMLADCSGKTNALRSISNRQFFERLVHDFDDMLTGSESDYRLYQVRWTQLPGPHKSLVQDYEAAAQYYDTKGRTWERQASIQLRTIAGDAAAGQAFVNSLSPWIYRRYIVDADEAGVGVLTRKILRQLSGREYLRWDDSNPSQGVQLIAKTVHLLLLTYGHQNDSLRSLNTFDAIQNLREHKKLSEQQAESLKENLQAFERLVLESSLDRRPTKEGRFHYRRQRSAKTFEATKNTLFDILLDEQPASGWPAEESDLIMDPSPPRAWVAHVLRKYNVDDPQAAYDLLSQMGEEEIFCLSTRKCRHHFAEIAPALLVSVSATPTPLNTLHNLNRITQSLGGKAVLWQLFSNTPSTMNAMVRLAASSPYLTSQLTQSPGMIDELVDSLLLGRLPSHQEVHETLDKYASKDRSLETLAQFKRAFMLRIGIRHLLGKSDARQTQTALSEVPDAIIAEMVRNYWLGSELGRNGPSPKPTHRFAIFAIGRYGARRLNFRDKLPMLLVYKGNDNAGSSDSGLLLQHVYDKLGQQILQQIQSATVGDRMYEAQFRWGPIKGRSQLALSEGDLLHLFKTATIEDKTATRTMRMIAGDADFAATLVEKVNNQFGTHDYRSLLATLKEAFNKYRWHSPEDRQQTPIDQRLAELRDLYMPMESLSRFGLGEKSGLADVEMQIMRFEIGAQLVCKSSLSELRKDPDSQRRLAYLLHHTDWDEVLTQLGMLEQHFIGVLEEFVSNAERQLRTPVSQMGSLDSNLCVE